jgi:hypothetical protein
MFKLELLIFLAIVYLLYKNKVQLKINNTIIVIIAILTYYFFFNKEGFTLSTALILDPNTLENNKVYSIGSIKTEAQITTTSPSINGGRDCLQFPTTVYKIAPVRDAICSVPNGTTQAGVDLANIDANYNIPDVGRKGYEIKFGPGTCVSDADIGPSGNGVCKLTNNINTTLKSPNGDFKLVLQDDGNMVLFNSANAIIWATNVFPGAGAAPYRLEMQRDGNLVIYNRSNGFVWATNRTSTNGPFRFALQNDSNLVVYDRNNGVVWNKGI